MVKKAYDVHSNKTGEKSDSLFGHEEKYFNPDGFMTKEILYRDETTELGYSKYRYDRKNNKIIEKQYSLDDRRQGKIISKIDKKGQTVEAIALDRNGDFDYRRVYTYDRSDRFPGEAVKIENYTQSPDHLTTTEKYKYDKQGNRKEKTLLDDEGIRQHYFYRYDDEGHLIQLLRHGYKDKIMDTLTYQYRFDATGNWTEKRIYKNGKWNAVVQQKMEYFKSAKGFTKDFGLGFVWLGFYCSLCK